MFLIFLSIFLLILIVFTIIFSILVYHLLRFRLPEKDHSKKIVVFFATGSIFLILLSLVLFFNIPWDLLEK